MPDQQQRHQYLDALGITSWLPVRPLPVAAPSADWVWDFRYPAPEIPFTPQPSANPGRPGAGRNAAAPVPPTMDAATARAALNDTLALVAESAKPKAERTKAQPQVKLAPKPKKPAAVPRFKLALLAVGDCLVIDALPTASPDDFSPRHQQLLKNIAAYLVAGPVELPRAGILNWPMLASSALDQSRPEALAAVQYKLKQLATRHNAKRLLLLGEVAAQMALDTDEALEQLRGAVQLPQQPQLQVVVSHSLSELLTLHALKATLWRDIQPILEH